MGQIQLLYERVLDCEGTPEQFYSYSINEVIDMIESYERRAEKKQKEQWQQIISMLDLFGANLIEKVIFTLSRKKDGVGFSLTEYFPELFSKEKSVRNGQPQPDEKPKLSAEMELYKAKRMYHAYRVNRARNRDGGGYQNGR